MTQEAEVCWICDQPIDDGDEPGWVRLDDGTGPQVPICSVACTEAFFAEVDKEAGRGD